MYTTLWPLLIVLEEASLGSKYGFHCSPSNSITVLDNPSVVNDRGVIESFKSETKVAQSGMYKIEEREVGGHLIWGDLPTVTMVTVGVLL